MTLWGPIKDRECCLFSIHHQGLEHFRKHSEGLSKIAQTDGVIEYLWVWRPESNQPLGGRRAKPGTNCGEESEAGHCLGWRGLAGARGRGRQSVERPRPVQEVLQKALGLRGERTPCLPRAPGPGMNTRIPGRLLRRSGLPRPQLAQGWSGGSLGGSL